ncbi:MAG TPA: thiamine pyrophosphate-requiring protein [Dehalococcoidia bacterium]|nr:thiamine pyrophosphate-requiring protein [Dehalococcoidia bacterium]
MKQVAVESTAEAYIELLAARGVDYFFGNGGTDFGPIVDAYAKRLEQELPVPKPVTVPHEITAMAMAAGYAMVKRKPQVVMVHTIPGTANATGGLINARSNNVPMLFSAGRTPLTESGLKGSRNGGIHWAQESRDQGSMVREWVKWDYELRDGVDLEGVVDRALAITQSEPQGPVYLSLPREVLAKEIDSFSYSERPRMQANHSMASPDSIAEVAKLLAKAKNPIAVTSALGRDPEAVPHLVKLAEMLNMPVFAGGTYMNFPVTHKLHQGGMAGPALKDADVILVFEQDVPWMPSMGAGPNEDATVVGVGVDPLFTNFPLRSFPVHVNLTGIPRYTLEALINALGQESLDKTAIAARGERWSANHDKVRQAAKERGLAGKDEKPLNKAWVSYCFEQARDENMTFVSELGLDFSQMEFTQPNQYYGVSTAGVLGWGVGAGLGAKLAMPDRTVIACIGDGSYMFGVPEAGHWVSRKMNLPVLYVVWNNSRWNAVASATRGVYPDGWQERTSHKPFSDLSPSLDFDMIVQAAGGYGERVDDPAEVPAAIERALHAVRVEKRQALLNIVGA